MTPPYTLEKYGIRKEEKEIKKVCEEHNMVEILGKEMCSKCGFPEWRLGRDVSENWIMTVRDREVGLE